MAIAVAVKIGFEDADKKRTSTVVRIPTAFSLPQMTEFGQGVAQFLANVSNCKITGVSLTFEIDFAGLGLGTVAALAANVGKKALFLWNTITGGRGARFTIPTFDEAFVSLTGDAVLIADPDVAAFISAIENGLVVPVAITVDFTNSRSYDIVSLKTASELHAKAG